MNSDLKEKFNFIQRNNSVPLNNNSLLSLRQLEDYIKPTKEKMRQLYSNLFDSAAAQDSKGKEKDHALLYKNLMIEASRGLKALDECSLIVNQDKANIINKKICLEEIKECNNDLLKRCVKVPKATETLKKYLTGIELAELEPTIKALLKDNREVPLVNAIRKVIKDELLKEYARVDRMRRRILMEQFKKKQAGDKSAATPIPKECKNIINAITERQKVPIRTRIEHSQKKQQQIELNRKSQEIDVKLKHLKFEIETMHVRDQKAYQSVPKQNRSLQATVF